MSCPRKRAVARRAAGSSKAPERAALRCERAHGSLTPSRAPVQSRLRAAGDAATGRHRISKGTCRRVRRWVLLGTGVRRTARRRRRTRSGGPTRSPGTWSAIVIRTGASERLDGPLSGSGRMRTRRKQPTELPVSSAAPARKSAGPGPSCRCDDFHPANLRRGAILRGVSRKPPPRPGISSQGRPLGAPRGSAT